MNDFVDRFSEELEDKKQDIRDSLDQDLGSGSTENVEKRFQQVYTSSKVEELGEEVRVLATDAGRNEMELKNNTRLYIVQAAAVDTKGEISKSLDLDSVKVYRQRDYEKFMQRASELEEVNSILEALDQRPAREKTIILIDGTLLTRLLTVPEPLDISKNREIRVKLMDAFGELIERTQNNSNIVLAGVSKDSNSSILYRKIVGDLLETKIKKLETEKLESIGFEDKQFLLKNYHRIRYNPQEIRQNLENLRKSNADQEKVKQIEKLVEKYRVRVSDTELIERMTSKPGFTKPLRIGKIKPDFFSAIEKFQQNRENYLKDTFPQVHNEEGDSFVERYQDAIQRIKDAPGVVSTYYKPSERDSALRVDLLNHDIDGTDLMDCDKQEFVNINKKVREVLRLLKSGYAGEEMHNVWISQADNSASLKNSDLEKIYKPIISKQLDINLRNYMRRRDKRA
ncbi:MAG: NurA family nuclease [Candidatus Nanosalina sp. J07AB43]|nr:MAG: NurA family nuclease [Candidatus Nanosalina sp. J07AB43]